jgi:hypothetical protein
MPFSLDGGGHVADLITAILAGHLALEVAVGQLSHDSRHLDEWGRYGAAGQQGDRSTSNDPKC